MAQTEYATREDAELVKLAKAGDEEAETELLTRYKDRIRGLARAYYILGADREDVVQEGMIGLFKAIRTYDEEGGSSFGTYAALCADRQIMDAVKRASRKKHSPLNESVSLQDSEEAGTLPSSAATAGLMPGPEEALAVLPSHLSRLENDVFQLYMKGESPGDIAKSLGKSPKSVYNALVRVKRKIRDLFR